MKSTSHARIAALVLSCVSVLAAEERSVELQRAASLMSNQHWDLAYDVFSEIGEQQLANDGARASFGKVLYSMGLCQMELAKSTKEPVSSAHYRSALEAFTRCHDWQGVDSESNRYRQRSLLRMGMCQQALGNFDQAEAYYDQFLLEKNQVYDRYDHGNLLLNLAQCAAMKKVPDDAKAQKFLRLAYDERERHELTKIALLDATLAIHDQSSAVTPLELRQQYLQWAKELFPVEHEEVDAMAQRVCRSAAIALKDGGTERALEVLTVLPWISQWLAAHDNGSEMPSKMEMHREAGVVESFEWLARTYGEATLDAYSVYDFLLNSFPQAESAQDWLYQNILFDFKAGDGAKAVQRVAGLRRAFPDSKYLVEIQLLEMGFLFDSGHYDQVLKLAKQGLEGSAELGISQETCLYLMAGSSSFLADYPSAIEFSRQYRDDFPEGKFLSQVLYFEAVSYARMGYQSQAREKLELVGSTEGSMRDFARFELAVLDFDFGLYESSLSRLKGMRDEKLEQALRVQVSMLAARASAILGDRATAEMYYLEALPLAREDKLLILEQELLYYIVAFYGREKIAGEENQQMAQCIPFYDAFFDKFDDSVYANQVATEAMPALQSVGQADRGIQTLTAVLKRSCEDLRQAGMQDAARALVWARMDRGEKLVDIRSELEGGDIFTEVMRFALAGVYSAGIDQASLSWGKKLKYDALERTMYAEISSTDAQVLLPAYIQLALGDWFLEEGFFPELALSKFEVNVDLSLQKNMADLGRAKSLRLIGGEKNVIKAQSILEGLVERSKNDPQLNEKARFELIETHASAEHWDILTALSRRYLIDDGVIYQRARVSYLLALSYDKRGMIEDAIANYSRVFSSFTRLLPVSAPAVDRLIVLTWQRNSPAVAGEPSDKQVAYQLGHRYLTLVADYPVWEKSRANVAPYLTAIQGNIEAWENSGEVVSVKQMLKEMRQGKR